MQFVPFRHIVLLLLIINGLSSSIIAQTNVICDSIFLSTNELVLDSAYIAESSININGLSSEDFEYDVSTKSIRLLDAKKSGVYTLCYRTLPEVFGTKYQVLDTSVISFKQDPKQTSPFKLTDSYNYNDLFGSSLNKSGSISRGVNVGNNQNLSVNSNLNLQLSGQLAPEIQVTASVTDDNIPIQPQGNTQQLQDFDQVYIRVFNEEKWSLTAGDFWLNKPKGYFMTYKKRAQGGTFSGLLTSNEVKKGELSVEASAALSKGKFARNQIQGVEGNQGPYRLSGANNEPFIIVLSGTERVYIDGQLLTRGQNNDYVIDYNTAEVSFTPKNLITKDRRIVIEFQYTDQNYARSLFQSHINYARKKGHVFLNVYSEQDARNQPLQLQLNDVQRQVLSFAGDNPSAAFASSIDTAVYAENRILYRQVDTVTGSGNYTILVYEPQPDTNLYKATFSNLGQGNGNYVLNEITAIGRTYRWVEPIGGVPQGTHEPVIELAAPSMQQMISAGGEIIMNENNTLNAEGVFSNYDKNTFSSLDSRDNQGFGGKLNWQLKKELSDKARFESNIGAEFVHENFQRIERFRAVEFERNWNVLQLQDKGHQLLGNANFLYKRKGLGGISYGLNTFQQFGDYEGLRNHLTFDLGKQTWKTRANASYLRSQGRQNSSFLRHKAYFSKTFGKVAIEYNDEHELNSLRDTTLISAYQFYDYQISLKTVDSIKNIYAIYFRQRHEKRPDSSEVLRNASLANHFGFDMQFLKNRNNQLKLNLAYRNLNIIDRNLLNLQGDNTVVGRLEHKGRWLKGAIITSTYYELGSGLELKREFLYIEVQAGQGVYTWIDYNEDGVKDLNEFEIAAFSDQANYVRVFAPTNDYVKTFTNQFSQSLFLKPGNVWRSEKGIRGFIARLSNQLVYRADRKTNTANPEEFLNPLITEIADTSLISLSNTIRNTFFFNRTNQKFGMDYTFQNNSSKTLLTSGFDSRNLSSHLARLRWNLSRTFTLILEAEDGNKINTADYVSGRNFVIDYSTIQAKFSYQPSTKFRVSLEGIYEDKLNIIGLEEAVISNVGTEVRYNVLEKGSLSAKINYVNNKYTGDDNTNLAYEMLDALKTGNNLTWQVLYQRSINEFIQLNLNYSGRKTPDNSSIHTGGVQVRAIF